MGSTVGGYSAVAFRSLGAGVRTPTDVAVLSPSMVLLAAGTRRTGGSFQSEGQGTLEDDTSRLLLPDPLFQLPLHFCPAFLSGLSDFRLSDDLREHFRLLHQQDPVSGDYHRKPKQDLQWQLRILTRMTSKYTSS